jgi:hypothetical protein
MEGAASTAGLRLQIYNASTPDEIDTAFESMAHDHIPALSVAADPFFDTCRDQLIALAAQRAGWSRPVPNQKQPHDKPNLVDGGNYL